LEDVEMDGLTVGRMVHYVAYGTPKGEYEAGAHRAAVVAEVFDKEAGIVKLAIFNPTGIHWNESTYSEEKTPGTWHWIEKA
jgi:hypothetical protein